MTDVKPAQIDGVTVRRILHGMHGPAKELRAHGAAIARRLAFEEVRGRSAAG
jgi:hypothetical protein